MSPQTWSLGAVWTIRRRFSLNETHLLRLLFHLHFSANKTELLFVMINTESCWIAQCIWRPPNWFGGVSLVAVPYQVSFEFCRNSTDLIITVLCWVLRDFRFLFAFGDHCLENTVEKWLKQHGLECYAERFVKENISLESFPELTDDNLKGTPFFIRNQNTPSLCYFKISTNLHTELGMTMGHRVVFKRAVSDMLKGKGIQWISSSYNIEGTTPSSSPTGSLLGDTDSVEYSCKVIVVGDQNTGKTSLIERYTHGTFDKGYKATVRIPQ